MAQLIDINDAPTAGANPWLDSLVDGGAWSQPSGGTAQLTYFFQSGIDPNAFSGIADGQIWTAEERAAFVGVFAAWSAVAKISFSKASSKSAADLWYWKGVGFDFPEAILAWHELPSLAVEKPLYGAFNQDGYGWSPLGLKPGGLAYLTILHEIGHGLGLAHPHSPVTAFPGVTKEFGSYGTYNLNQGIFTTMSYNDGWQEKFATLVAADYGVQMTPMALDIAAIQLIYGANRSYHTGADTYELPGANALGTGWACIWDAGGYDRISAALVSRSAVIDLRAATLTGAKAGGYVSWHGGIAGGYTIANGVVIEAATGGLGNDVIIGNDVANALKGGAGNDTVRGMAGNDVIDGGSGSDKLYGSAGDDRLLASAGNDVLNGESGTDTANYSSVTGNTSINLAKTGYQHTRTSGYDSFLNIENIIAGGGNDTLSGSAISNRIDAGKGDDRVSGGGGEDVLLGSAGNDNYIGGLGSDTLNFANTTIAVHVNLSLTTRQFVSSVFGSDVVYSIEEVISGAGNDKLTGSAVHNVFRSGGGSDIINGGGGADAMFGGTGNDTYHVDNIGDQVTEYANQGIDTVHSSVAVSALGADDADCALVGLHVETIRLNGTAAISAKGNALDNTISGNEASNLLSGLAGNDMLSGGDGADILIGGAGNDTLGGGLGADHFVFDMLSEGGVDVIVTFNASNEIIELDITAFTAFTVTGQLATGQLTTGTQAFDADDFLIFDPLTGELFYDPDANGSLSGVHIATLTPAGYAGTLSEANILLI